MPKMPGSDLASPDFYAAETSSEFYADIPSSNIKDDDINPLKRGNPIASHDQPLAKKPRGIRRYQRTLHSYFPRLARRIPSHKTRRPSSSQPTFAESEVMFYMVDHETDTEELIENPFAIQLMRLGRALEKDISEARSQLQILDEITWELFQYIELDDDEYKSFSPPNCPLQFLRNIERMHQCLETASNMLRARSLLEEEFLELRPLNELVAAEMLDNPIKGMGMRHRWLREVLRGVCHIIFHKCTLPYKMLRSMESSLAYFKEKHARLLKFAWSSRVCDALAILHKIGCPMQRADTGFIGVDIDPGLRSPDTAAAFRIRRELLLLAEAMSQWTKAQPRQTVLFEFWEDLW